jgi:hypothetical protein
MKKLIKAEDVTGEGLIGLLGENVVLYCLNYIYAGKLVGVNDDCIKLENVHIVFETGTFGATFKHAERLSNEHYIQKSAIESFGITVGLK